MKKPWPAPKLCVQCSHSKHKHPGSWNGSCWHPLVIMKDDWALANNHEGQPIGSSCSTERGKRFGVCGRKGKLWEKK